MKNKFAVWILLFFIFQYAIDSSIQMGLCVSRDKNIKKELDKVNKEIEKLQLTYASGHDATSTTDSEESSHFMRNWSDLVQRHNELQRMKNPRKHERELLTGTIHMELSGKNKFIRLGMENGKQRIIKFKYDVKKIRP